MGVMISSKDPFKIDSHKMQYHVERLAQWKSAQSLQEKLEVYPIYVEISPVGHCNHRCSFCAVDYIGYKTRRIETGVLCRTLLDMSCLGVKSVMFAGEGEPMLHPEIDVITNYSCKVGLDVAFTTNGSALTKKFVDNSLESIKWIKVSLNGGENSYGLVHRVKQLEYDRVWSNISYAVRQRGKGAVRPAIGIQCVVIPENSCDLRNIALRAKQTGCDYLVLKPYSQHKSSITQTYKEVSYQEEKIKEDICEACQEETGDFKVIVRTSAMEEWDGGTHSYSKCLATPYFWAYIMATGDIYSCSAYLLNPDFNLGNINVESFKEIWTGEKRASHLSFMDKLDISKCRLNCRMNQVNKYLSELVNPNPHANFI